MITLFLFDACVAFNRTSGIRESERSELVTMSRAHTAAKIVEIPSFFFINIKIYGVE